MVDNASNVIHFIRLSIINIMPSRKRVMGWERKEARNSSGK